METENNLNIKMFNKPRGTGKSNFLKLCALEEQHKKTYDYICIIGHSLTSEKEFDRWLRSMNLQYEKIIVGMQTLIDRSRCCDFENVLVLIDEPYIMDTQKQIAILKDLKRISSYKTIDVVGCGTDVEAPVQKLFKDFIE